MATTGNENEDSHMDRERLACSQSGTSGCVSVHVLLMKTIAPPADNCVPFSSASETRQRRPHRQSTMPLSTIAAAAGLLMVLQQAFGAHLRSPSAEVREQVKVIAANPFATHWAHRRARPASYCSGATVVTADPCCLRCDVQSRLLLPCPACFAALASNRRYPPRYRTVALREPKSCIAAAGRSATRCRRQTASIAAGNRCLHANCRRRGSRGVTLCRTHACHRG